MKTLQKRDDLIAASTPRILHPQGALRRLISEASVPGKNKLLGASRQVFGRRHWMRHIFVAAFALFPTYASASLLDMHGVPACMELSSRAVLLDETKAVLDRMIEGVPEVSADDRERFRNEVPGDPEAYEALKDDSLYRAYLVLESYDGMVRFLEESKADDPRETVMGVGMVLLLMPDLLEGLEGYGGLDIEYVKGIRYEASMRLGTLIECSVRSLMPMP